MTPTAAADAPGLALPAWFCRPGDPYAHRVEAAPAPFAAVWPASLCGLQTDPADWTDARHARRLCPVCRKAMRRRERTALAAIRRRFAALLSRDRRRLAAALRRRVP